MSQLEICECWFKHLSNHTLIISQDLFYYIGGVGMSSMKEDIYGIHKSLPGRIYEVNLNDGYEVKLDLAPNATKIRRWFMRHPSFIPNVMIFRQFNDSTKRSRAIYVSSDEKLIQNIAIKKTLCLQFTTTYETAFNIYQELRNHKPLEEIVKEYNLSV